MFDEFGSLYRGREDILFESFIDAGQYIQWPCFKKELSESKGYYQYCGDQMRRLLYKSSDTDHHLTSAHPMRDDNSMAIVVYKARPS